MIDPVCGMTVTHDTAAAAWEFGDVTYYFCSVNCMERFKQDPEDYVDKDPTERHL